MSTLKQKKVNKKLLPLFFKFFGGSLLILALLTFIVFPVLIKAAGVIGDTCSKSADCSPGYKCDTSISECVSAAPVIPNATPPPDTGVGNTIPTVGGGPPVFCGEGTENINGLCQPISPFKTTGSIASSGTITDLATKILKALLFLSGIIAVLVIIIGGFWYITSAGNTEQAEKGQRALTNAIIGLIVVILAYAIVNIITSSLTSGVDSTGGTTTTTKRTGVNPP
jgi:hypothetical protein